MKSKKDYSKELEVQKALGILPKFIVERIDCNINPAPGVLKAPDIEKDIFLTRCNKGRSWFLSAETCAVNEEQAISHIIQRYKFPRKVRKCLRAHQCKH